MSYIDDSGFENQDNPKDYSQARAPTFKQKPKDGAEFKEATESLFE